jgi:hypothetical protein
LHAMVHINLASARLQLRLREVHANDHIATVLLVRRFVRLDKPRVLVLVLVLVHLVLRRVHCGVVGRPHLEWRRRVLGLGRMHRERSLRGRRRAGVRR